MGSPILRWLGWILFIFISILPECLFLIDHMDALFDGISSQDQYQRRLLKWNLILAGSALLFTSDILFSRKELRSAVLLSTSIRSIVTDVHSDQPIHPNSQDNRTVLCLYLNQRWIEPTAAVVLFRRYSIVLVRLFCFACMIVLCWYGILTVPDDDSRL